VPAVTGAARRQVEGLVGSQCLEDARALLALVRRGEAEDGEPLGEGRMRWALERDGSPLMQGAVGAARVQVGREAPEAFGEWLGAWVAAAAAPGAMAAAGGRLRSARMAARLLESARTHLRRRGRRRGKYTGGYTIQRCSGSAQRGRVTGLDRA